MKKENLFISNYLRIEEEVLKLSQYVDFSDEQLGVYSPVICELLIRCGVEIESLCKELYRRDVDKKLPKTVGEITKVLDKIYMASEKIILLDNPRFSFVDFRLIKPLSYEPESDDDFHDVFCKLKHDRGENYHKATLRILLLALSGLYILNQLFLDRKIMIRNDFFGEDIPEFLREDTMIFAVPVSTYNWDLFGERFEMLKKQSGLSEEQVNRLEEKWMSNTSLKRNSYSDDSCLFSVELIPEYQKVMDSFTSTDYFKREQLFAILDRSISVINDYYEVTSEDKEAVLRKILKYIYIMRKTQFVFNPNSAFRSNRDNLHFTAGLVFRTRDSFLIELKQIQEKHNEPYIAELITEIEKDKAAVSDNNSGGCYVATCVYGSYDCPQVWTLRRYRDTTLADRWYGRAFIHAYYAISPTLVKWFGETAWFKKMWKGRLDRMVKRLNENGVESTPYQDKEW